MNTIVGRLVVATFTLVVQAIPTVAQSPVQDLNQVRSLAGPNPATVLLQSADELNLSARQKDRLREIEQRVDELNADAIARPPERMGDGRAAVQQQEIPEGVRHEREQRLHAARALRLMHVNNRRAGVDVFALLTPEQQMLARELLGAARAEAQRLTRPN